MSRESLQTTGYPLTSEDIENYINMQEGSLTPQIITLHANQHPIELITFFSTLESSRPLRKQLLINYQDHWFGLDIESTANDQPFSIVMLDAANTLNKIACFMLVLNQICTAQSLIFDLFHLASENPLQKNSSDCSLFALEHLGFAARKENLHSQLQALRNIEDQEHLLAFASQSIMEKTNFPGHIKRQLIEELGKINWIDYSKLERNPEEWRDFFINTQSNKTPGFLSDTLKNWRIEKRSPDGRWKIHNIRINYCARHIKDKLSGKEPSSERDVILDMICSSHQLPREKIEQVFKIAIDNKLYKQIGQLVKLGAISETMARNEVHHIADTLTRQVMTRLLDQISAPPFISRQLHTPTSLPIETAMQPIQTAAEIARP